ERDGKPVTGRRVVALVNRDPKCAGPAGVERDGSVVVAIENEAWHHWFAIQTDTEIDDAGVGAGLARADQRVDPRVQDEVGDMAYVKICPGSAVGTWLHQNALVAVQSDGVVSALPGNH